MANRAKGGARQVASYLITAGQRAEIVTLLNASVGADDIRCFRLTSLTQDAGQQARD